MKSEQTETRRGLGRDMPTTLLRRSLFFFSPQSTLCFLFSFLFLFFFLFCFAFWLFFFFFLREMIEEMGGKIKF